MLHEHAWERRHIEGETDDLHNAARSRLYEVKGTEPPAQVPLGPSRISSVETS